MAALETMTRVVPRTYLVRNEFDRGIQKRWENFLSKLPVTIEQLFQPKDCI